MSYVQSPDEYPNNRRATWVEPATERVYQTPVAPADEIEAERASVRRRRTISRAGQIIYILLGALDALLIIRFALKLLGANPDAGFSSFIYGITQVFVAPFEGVFPSPQTSGSVVEVSTLLAIIVYALIAWLVVSIIDTLTRRTPERVV